jgi:hypothetical protein
MISLYHSPSETAYRDSKEVNVGVSMVDEVDNCDSRFTGPLRLVSRCPMMKVGRLTYCLSWS